jgi:hypothetical protein
MKLTKERLDKIVYEEIQNLVEDGIIDEGWIDRLGARAKGGLARVGSRVKGVGMKAAGGLAKMAGEKELGAKLTARGKETSAGGAEAAKQARIRSILSVHIKELNNDLTKLGVANDPKVMDALEYLERAIESSSAKTGKEYQRTAAREE